MKRIFQQICELYSYIYYRIYTWLAKYFGKYYTADQIGFLLPMILLTMSLAPIYNLCSFMISVDFKDSIFVFCIIHAFFIVRMSNAFTRSLPQMDKKYRKESKVQRKKRLKKVILLVVVTVFWFITYMFIAVMEASSVSDLTFPSPEIMEQLKDIRNS